MRKLCTLLLGILLTTISSFAALPSKVFAPYVDVMLWPTFDLASVTNATGQKYFTLAFITAGSNGQPAWGGVTAYNNYPELDARINALKAAGGDIIVSFGGLNGTPIDATITNVSSLVAAYSAVIDRYSLTWIDFDIEGTWVSDQASIDRRNQAAKQLQTKYPSLRITYCLPVMPFGLTADGVNIINKAKAAGVNIYGVNVMAMDYGQSNSAMGQAAISAAQNARNQTNLNIGITPMIGKNDTQNETFTLANASEVMTFAQSTSWVNMIAMWSVNRDNGNCPNNQTASYNCSGLSQSLYAFVNTFKAYSGGVSCTPTSIVPYITVNGGAWQSTTSVSVTAGANVQIAPHPLNVGSWSWSGPNGFTSSSRVVTLNSIQTNQGGSYTATYTNAQGCTSTTTFTVTVSGGCTSTPIVPYISVNGGAWQNTLSVTVTAGNSVGIEPQPAIGGSWSWSGPNGFSAATRKISLANIQTSQGGSYTASYTNAQGCKSTATFTVTVNGTGGGCNGVPQYATGVTYNAGSVVQNVGSRYECKPWPFSGWCSQGGGFTPGVGFAWESAWTLLGSCSGRMAQPEVSVVEDSFEANGLGVYPMPGVSGKDQTLTFTFEKNPDEVKVLINDMNGSEVINKKYTDVNNSIEVSMPALPKGFYIINVHNGKKIVTKKYIVR
jgi:hypothetical protein